MREMTADTFFFFFQAEDGIRDADVTGVQTCALPISGVLGLSGTLRLPRAVSLWRPRRAAVRLRGGRVVLAWLTGGSDGPGRRTASGTRTRYSAGRLRRAGAGLIDGLRRPGGRRAPNVAGVVPGRLSGRRLDGLVRPLVVHVVVAHGN